MALPKVAIVGRPNVGKSSLLNALAGENISIVEQTPGVTRDRISTIIEADGRYFELIDTGGYGIVDCQRLDEHIAQQIRLAVTSADVVVFVVDIRDGLMPLDAEIAQLLRKEQLDIIPVANKADHSRMFTDKAEFDQLGFGEFICISVKNNINKTYLMEKIVEKLSRFAPEKPVEPEMKIAIVGKRNAGKSTMVNAIAGNQRVIVSEMPGTTRDAVDVRFEKDGKTYLVIDTAGVRKKSSMTDSIEFYSYVRATRSIRRADIVFFLIDSVLPVSQVDKKLAKFITSEYKSCIIIVNKWDLVKDNTSTGDYEEYLTKLLPGLKNAPIAFTTATEAKNVQSVLDLASEIYKQATTWIPTAKLNKALELIKHHNVLKRKSGQTGSPKIYYATQVAVNPVSILLFVNNPQLFEENYRKFIIGKLQSALPIDEVPVKTFYRRRRD